MSYISHGLFVRNGTKGIWICVPSIIMQKQTTTHTFKKHERLKKQTEIDRLFKEGHSFFQYPYRWVWMESDLPEKSQPVQLGVSVSKRKFKLAVDRNRVKRLMREAWRLHKHNLYDHFPEGKKVVLMLIYSVKEQLEYQTIENGTKRGMKKLVKEIENPTPKKKIRTKMIFGWIIFVLFLGCCLIQFGYWAVIFSKLATYKNIARTGVPKIPVSVIICAYNEEENLRKYLPKILEQDYPNFQVLVVDDASTDASSEVLKKLKQKYPHLDILTLEYPDGKKFLGKKNALSQGIQAAGHDNILVTDADCYPKSKAWIQGMVNLYQEGNLVLGYGPYEERGGLLNAFIRFETVYTAIQYLSFALWGNPYMGVGRNMMYDRQLFQKVDGFESHKHVASGDDDLFVNQVAVKNNTRIQLDKSTFMYSAPKETFSSYIRQKNRHNTTGRHYKPIHQLLLGLLSASHFGMYVFLLILAFAKFGMLFAVIIFTMILMVKAIIFKRIANQLQEHLSIFMIPVLDAAYTLYYVIFAPALLMGKTNKWK